MSRISPQQVEIEASILQGRLKNRDNPFGEEHQATLDDLVFLPANLSRLVIDPYREDCNTRTDLGAIESLRMEIPFIVTGLDEAPGEVRAAYASAIAQHGAASLGRRPLGEGARWLQLADTAGPARSCVRATISPPGWW
jgi:hypothetical protein